MKNSLIFKGIYTHRIELSKETSYELFNESSKDEKSVTEYSEDQIIDWIFQNTIKLGFFSQELYKLNPNDLFIDFRVKEPVLTPSDQKKIGDIDMLICPKSTPENTTVIEFKRIKVRSQKDQTINLNKLERCKTKGFSQIKELRKFNFWKTYLGILIEDDARELATPNTLIRSSEGKSIQQVYRISNDINFDKQSGIIFLHIGQPTGEDITIRNNFEICVDVLAPEQKQNVQSTRRVIEWKCKLNSVWVSVCFQRYSFFLFDQFSIASLVN